MASRNGGMKDIIDDGINGLTVETGNVSRFVAAVESVLHDTDLATTISDRAIASTHVRHWGRYAEQCTMFYERLQLLTKRA